MIEIGIVGGTGYTGVELLRLLAEHPQARVRTITSRKDAGTRVADLFPSLRGKYPHAFVGPADADLASCNVVFFATPHGVAMAQARELVAAGVKIIDLDLARRRISLSIKQAAEGGELAAEYREHLVDSAGNWDQGEASAEAEAGWSEYYGETGDAVAEVEAPLADAVEADPVEADAVEADAVEADVEPAVEEDAAE